MAVASVTVASNSHMAEVVAAGATTEVAEEVTVITANNSSNKWAVEADTVKTPEEGEEDHAAAD